MYSNELAALLKDVLSWERHLSETNSSMFCLVDVA